MIPGGVRWVQTFLISMLLIVIGAAQENAQTTVGVTLASVYREPSEASECLTQVFLGDPVKVQKIQGGWARVLVPDQYRTTEGYPGWLRVEQLKKSELSPASKSLAVAYPLVYLREEPSTDGAILKQVFLATRLTLAPGGKPVSAGGERWLPVRLAGDDRSYWVRGNQVVEEQMLREGQGDVIIDRARLFKGTPYLWGGMSQRGIDCSGLVYTVYRVHGVTVPRDADQQFQIGEAVDSEDLQAGDLVFFGTKPSDITHVGIYAGSGMFIHASSGRGVVMSPLFQGWYLERYQGARRILDPQGSGTKSLVPQD